MEDVFIIEEIVGMRLVKEIEFHFMLQTIYKI